MSSYEGYVRLTVFACSLLLMMLFERRFPARRRDSGTSSTIRHDVDNLVLGVIGSLLLRLTPGILAAHLAIQNETWELGLSHTLGIGADSLALIIATIIALDFAIYWQHRYFHYNRYLWKLHRVHHSDKSLNASSALRFHPIEIGISMLIKSTLVISLGIPFIAVVFFEIALNACAIFNHANIRLPKKPERIIRYLVVTPSMHRIHHSIERRDSDSNFGFCLSIWDRIFGSYRQIIHTKKKDFEMGVKEIESSQVIGVRNLLVQPFKY